MEQTDLSKYARQTVLPGIGIEGQRRLLASHAAIIGCGTLGCVIADQLCRAGVGRLTILDRDLVEPGNLQRQVLFDRADAEARLPKAEAALERLGEINSDVRVRALVADLRPSNAEALLFDDKFGRPEVILDGTDNFETRFLLNDLCVKHAVPYVYAGVVGTRAMRAVFRAQGCCLRCVFDRPPAPGSQPTCETAGVLAPAAAMIGAMQAAEAIKLLVGAEVAMDLVEIDAWGGLLRRVDLSRSRDPDCPCCAQRRFEFLEGPDPEAAALCGRNAVQVMPGPQGTPGRLDLESLAGSWRTVGTVSRSAFMVRVEPYEQAGVTVSVFRDGRAVIEGVEDPSRARAIYARYVGA
ncbi:MAG: ThiF family adenylyltransferase [Phycisphaerales bacterium]|nr:ThiF family adenylyltransferase [Planctomycetota bacterium]MCH8508220.1 ThiF family adenylyltransferase [Phycisphaerales bacterium]